MLSSVVSEILLDSGGAEWLQVIILRMAMVGMNFSKTGGRDIEVWILSDIFMHCNIYHDDHEVFPLPLRHFTFFLFTTTLRIMDVNLGESHHPSPELQRDIIFLEFPGHLFLLFSICCIFSQLGIVVLLIVVALSQPRLWHPARKTRSLLTRAILCCPIYTSPVVVAWPREHSNIKSDGWDVT